MKARAGQPQLMGCRFEVAPQPERHARTRGEGIWLTCSITFSLPSPLLCSCRWVTTKLISYLRPYLPSGANSKCPRCVTGIGLCPPTIKNKRFVSNCHTTYVFIITMASFNVAIASLARSLPRPRWERQPVHNVMPHSRHTTTKTKTCIYNVLS